MLKCLFMYFRFWKKRSTSPETDCEVESQVEILLLPEVILIVFRFCLWILLVCTHRLKLSVNHIQILQYHWNQIRENVLFFVIQLCVVAQNWYMQRNIIIFLFHVYVYDIECNLCQLACLWFKPKARKKSMWAGTRVRNCQHQHQEKDRHVRWCLSWNHIFKELFILH